MWRRVGIVVLAGLVARAICLWMVGQRLPFLTDPVGDAGYWLAVARGTTPGGPPADPPGFITWLRLAFASGPVAAVLNLLLNTGTILLAAAVADRWFGPREAIRTAVLLSVAAAVTFFDTQVLEAAPAALLVTGAVLLALRGDRTTPQAMTRADDRHAEQAIADGVRPEAPARGDRVRMGLAGLSSGILAAFMPGFLFAGIAVSAWLLKTTLDHRRHRSLATAWLVGLALGVVVTIDPGVFRRVPVPWPAGAGVRFYLANNPAGTGLPGPIPPEFSGARALQASESDSFEVAALGMVLDDGPALGFWTASTVSRVFAQMGGWLRLQGRKALLLVTRIDEEPGASQALEMARVPLRLAMPLPTNVLLFAGLIGLILAAGGASWRRGARATLGVASAFLLTAVASAFVEWPLGRLRFTVLPLLAAFAAHAMVRADDAWRSGHRRAVAAITTVLVVATAATWVSRAGPWRRPHHEASLLVTAGVSREARGDTTAAEALWSAALTLVPTHLEARLRRSERAMIEHDLARAITELEAARRGTQGDFALHNNLGILYVQAQRFTDAEPELAAATRLSPESPGPWYWRGQVARFSGDTTAAVTYYREAIKRNPRYALARARLVDTLFHWGKKDEARKEVEAATEAAVALPPELLRLLGGDGTRGKP
jgi:tetratricopeptide (TPR) repeat protein